MDEDRASLFDPQHKDSVGKLRPFSVSGPSQDLHVLTLRMPLGVFRECILTVLLAHGDMVVAM